jgi:hypothetical protein
VKHSIRDLSRGIYQILYYPELATTHKVDIKYNGFAVPDSPIVLNARNPGHKFCVCVFSFVIAEYWYRNIMSKVSTLNTDRYRWLKATTPPVTTSEY